MKIVLYQPKIPQNTGNVVRTCSVTGASLALVAPLGFSVNNRWLKRAGLDYWEGVDVEIVEDFKTYLEKAKGNVYLFSSKAKKHHTDVVYTPDDWLIFGSETDGLPDWLYEAYPSVKIPMQENARCLNLASSVAVGLYEAWRQTGFN